MRYSCQAIRSAAVLAAAIWLSGTSHQSPPAGERGGDRPKPPATAIAPSAAPVVLKPPVQRTVEQPCRRGEDNRSSDLCAQWKAADAAESAARAAWWLGVAGALIGGMTLFVAVKAALYARDAARHGEKGANATAESAAHAARAAKAAVDQHRAWIKIEDVSVSKVGYTKRTANGREHEYLSATITATMVNVGATPATNVEYQPQIWAFPFLRNYDEWWLMWDRAVQEFKERTRDKVDAGWVLFPGDRRTHSHTMNTGWIPVEGSFPIDGTNEEPIRVMGTVMVVYKIASGDEAYTTRPFLLDLGGKVQTGKGLAEVGDFDDRDVSLLPIQEAERAT